MKNFKTIYILMITLMVFACSKKEEAKGFQISVDLSTIDNITYGFHGVNQDGIIRPSITCNDSMRAIQIDTNKSAIIIDSTKISLKFDKVEVYKITDEFVLNGKTIPSFKVYRVWYQPFDQEVNEKLTNAQTATMLFSEGEQEHKFDFDEFDLQMLHELSVGHELPRSSAFLFDDFTKKLTIYISTTCLGYASRGLPSQLEKISSDLNDEEPDGKRSGVYRGTLTSYMQELKTITTSEFKLDLVFEEGKWIISGYDGSYNFAIYMFGEKYETQEPLDKSPFFKNVMGVVNEEMGPFPVLTELIKEE